MPRLERQTVAGLDLDGDSDTDVVGAYNNNLTWWENDGTPWDNSWDQYNIDSTLEQWEEIYVGNMDGDTDLDVVAISDGK